MAVSQVRGYKTPESRWQRNLALNKASGPVCQHFDDLTVERVKLRDDLKMTRKGFHDPEFLIATKKRHVVEMT